jgi:acetylornithine/succinyldiaminopimelate/putrescine aminotransferase
MLAPLHCAPSGWEAVRTDFEHCNTWRAGIVQRGERLRGALAEALKGNAHVKEIRGLGLITGIQLDVVRFVTATLPAPPCWHTCLCWSWTFTIISKTYAS